MMKLVACIAFMSVISTQTAAADFNPYLKPTDELGRRLQAAAFGEAGADRALQDWLVAHPEVASEEQIQGYHQLCNDYDALTWFQLRLTACACYQQLKEKSAGATDRHATAFAGQPPARTIGSTIVPLTWNAFGCQSVEVVSNRVSSSWFVDTGAEITVVKASLAKRMGIRPVAAKIGMGTATADVAGGAGIIDRLQIGNAIVENVPVIILPDSQLNVPGVGQIDGILGLQVFVAFGRIAWVRRSKPRLGRDGSAGTSDSGTHLLAR